MIEEREMKRARVLIAVAVVLLAGALWLSACQPAAPAVPVVETVEVVQTVQVVETQEVLVAAEVEVVSDRLALVRDRGYLICGVNSGVPGFGFLDPSGEFSGFDVDFCRAVAVAIFNDITAVEYRPLTAAERFTALQTGEIDVLIRNTTWTLQRDSELGADFAAVTFYDGQGLLVRVADGYQTLEDLDGATVCSLTGTTTERNIAEAFESRGLTFDLLLFDESQDTSAAYEEGRCDALTSDRSQLAGLRSAMADPEAHIILNETISKEPLGPVVAQGDQQWTDIVRWVVFGMVNAEELGVTSQNVDEMLASEDPMVQKLLGVTDNLGSMLGLGDDFMYNVISQVGNYGEVYDRNLGPEGTNIPRGINNLWNNGGILYAPPFR
jgi:general L-amino acid transport system substrate-binding protein